MASKTEICNFAISHLGSGKGIGNIDTEHSEEANACRQFYDMARDEMLREFPWPFASKTATLALVASDPSIEWLFSYRAPSDCLRIKRILSGERTDTEPVPYRKMSDSQGILVYTDMESAQMEYTAQITNTQLFDPDFVMALSLRLAAYIAPRLTSGDPFRMGARALQLWQMSVAKAQSTSVNEQQSDPDNDSPSILART